jgi:hypothetical protein
MTISIVGTLILNSDIIVDDKIEIYGTVIPIARDLVDTIYSCPTKDFLCQNGKSPTINSSESDIQILSGGLIDGLGQGFSANTGPGANSSLLDNQNDPSNIYGANHAGIGTVSNIPGTTELIDEFHTINALNLIQGKVTLNYTPIGGIVALNIVHGSAQIYGVDYIVTGDFISWEGYGLESIIASGDIIRVIYMAETSRIFPPPKGTYGSYEAPTSIGSGSGEASGGSGIRLVAHSGTVNINGTINVSGENGHSNRTGGGSGGSVWVDAYNIIGGGPIYAEGGDASYSYAGGGGGGYITLNYENSNTYSGTMSVAGKKGGTHGLITIEPREPFFVEKFTGDILNTKWWNIADGTVVLDNVVQMDTTTDDFSAPLLESLFQISGRNIQVDCDYIPSEVEPSYHTDYFRMFIDDRNWVQVARKHNHIFGMYSVDGFLSQSAQSYPYTAVTFRIVKSDSTFSFQYVDSTSPHTIVSETIPDFNSSSFKIALGTIKEEADSSNYITDHFTLTNIDEYNGYVTLSSLPVDASNVSLNVVGGSAQIYGFDYTVSGQNLSWIPANLNLLDGDEIIAQYMEDGTFNDLHVSWDNFKVYSGIMRGTETSRPVIYVDPEHGSDSSDGGPLTPLQHLFVATAWARRGGTVVLYSGNYDPTEVELKSLTIMGAYGSTAVISTSGVQDTTGSNWENSGLTFRDCQGLVSNVHITGAREAVYAEDTQNLEVSNCQIYDVTTAVLFTTYSKDCRILRNTIHDASIGLNYTNQNYTPQINSNVFYDTSTAVTLVDASGFVVSSNTFDNNQLCILVDNSSKGIVASNNLTNSVVGINVTSDSTISIFNSNYYGTGTAITGSGTVTDVSSINSFPGYTNTYLRNYHLLSFSPDRSTGTGTYDQFMIDRDGAERANDPSYDIGAYRYVHTQHPAGADYYVDGSGSDYINNGSINSPFRTIDKAMSVADSSIVVISGDYDSYYLKLKNENIQIGSVSVFVYPTNYEYILYYHEINSADVSRKFFYLPANIREQDMSNVALNFVHGPSQFYGTDFIMQMEDYEPKVCWDGLGLDGIIGVGDVARVLFKEGPTHWIRELTVHGHYSDLNLGRAIYVSNSGSDSTIMGGDGTNSGGNGTLERPYQTISRALSQSSAGDYLVVQAGDYTTFTGLNDRVIVPLNDYTSVSDGRVYFEDLFNTPYTMYPNHSLSDVSWDLDTTGNSDASIVEGYLYMSFDGTNPVTATSLFDFSPVGTDRTAFEVSAELRQAFDPVFFSVYNGPNVATFKVNDGDYTCSLLTDGTTYSCWGQLEDTSDGTNQFFTEYVCISSSEIQNKFLNLSYMIKEPSEVVVNVIGGTSQELGTDFYVEDNRVKWDGMTMDGQVKAGDVLRVLYIPHGLSDSVKVKFILENNALTVQGMVDGHYERLMKRAIHSPITGPWNTSFYMNTVDHSGGSSGRGYASRFLAIAESIENTGLAKPYTYKTWRQPIILHD